MDCPLYRGYPLECPLKEVTLHVYIMDFLLTYSLKFSHLHESQIIHDKNFTVEQKLNALAMWPEHFAVKIYAVQTFP